VKANYVLMKVRSKERADCTVLAAQHSLAISYEVAHAILAGLGRRNGCRFRFREVADRLNLHERIEFASYGTVHQLMIQDGQLQKGRFVVRTGGVHSGHTFAVVDGRIFDNRFNCLKCRVTHVWEIPTWDGEFLSRFPYLGMLAEVDKLPDIRAINFQRL
jgi:hypothetical protein